MGSSLQGNIYPSEIAQGHFISIVCPCNMFPFYYHVFYFFFSLSFIRERGGKNDTGLISKSMKVGYSQNSNKITEKSHLVNITFCFCLCLSFYTTWQLVVLCHISKLRFTNIWLGFNIPLHMDHSVSSIHCLPVQSEVEK